MCKCVNTCVNVLTHVYTCVDVLTHVYTCVNVLTHVYTCVHMCVHVSPLKRMKHLSLAQALRLEASPSGLHIPSILAFTLHNCVKCVNTCANVLTHVLIC